MTHVPANDSSVPHDQEPKLPIRDVDPKAFAAELSKRKDEIKKAVQSIEDAKLIRQEILDWDISI